MTAQISMDEHNYHKNPQKILNKYKKKKKKKTYTQLYNNKVTFNIFNVVTNFAVSTQVKIVKSTERQKDTYILTFSVNF